MWRALIVALLFTLAACRSRQTAPGEFAPGQSPAERAKLLTIPDEYKARSNPLPATEANVAEGRARYEAHCADCHAPNGKGDTPLGRSLFPRAGDLTSPQTRRYSDGQLYWIISEGIRYSGMPEGRRLHSEDQIWKLVLYLRRLTQ